MLHPSRSDRRCAPAPRLRMGNCQLLWTDVVVAERKRAARNIWLSSAGVSVTMLARDEHPATRTPAQILPSAQALSDRERTLLRAWSRRRKGKFPTPTSSPNCAPSRSSRTRRSIRCTLGDDPAVDYVERREERGGAVAIANRALPPRHSRAPSAARAGCAPRPASGSSRPRTIPARCPAA